MAEVTTMHLRVIIRRVPAMVPVVGRYFKTNNARSLVTFRVRESAWSMVTLRLELNITVFRCACPSGARQLANSGHGLAAAAGLIMSVLRGAHPKIPGAALVCTRLPHYVGI